MYKIILPNFEGPFDLLIYFIKRDELNIYDIPIARITNEFLNYIKLMEQYEIEIAGEFIVMAANLLRIKTQMLLPSQVDEDGMPQEDPRQELIQNILEYRQFKEQSEVFRSLYRENAGRLYRKNFDADLDKAKIHSRFKNATLLNLLRAFAIAINRNIEQEYHIVQYEQVTLEERIADIRNILTVKKRFTFSELVSKQNTRHSVIVFFLAILELLKQGDIFIVQEESFSELIIAESINK